MVLYQDVNQLSACVCGHAALPFHLTGFGLKMLFLLYFSVTLWFASRYSYGNVRWIIKCRDDSLLFDGENKNVLIKIIILSPLNLTLQLGIFLQVKISQEKPMFLWADKSWYLTLLKNFCMETHSFSFFVTDFEKFS